MKIMYFSDLHLHRDEVQIFRKRLLDQASIEKPDLILNAGDFSNTYNPDAIQDLRELGDWAPYVTVFGNHDFYENRVSHPDDGKVNVLDLGEYMVLSTTLWTDYFDGDPLEMDHYSYLNDKRFIPDWSAKKAHRKSKRLLKEVQNLVQENWNKKIILLTHHGVSKRSISPKFQGNPLNGSFVNDLDDWILMNPQIVLCVHGHVHQDFDYKIGETRIVCHPRGYPREENYSKYYAKFVEV